MNIVIVGDGKVGAALTEHLSKEGHDVVVIDKDPRVVEAMANTYDVMGLCGNGASYSVQKEAGVEKARLLIAATSSDELNILCCLVAKKIGARHTIARVRNPEYAQQLHFFREELGLSLVVNPEFAAANEIARILRFPTAINMESFAGDRVDLAEIKIGANNPLAGLCVRDIPTRFKARVLLCAVQRGEQVYIPNGSFQLEAGDRIHFTSKRSDMAAFMKELGIYKHPTKHVLIAGGGKMGYYLARQLSETGHRVKVIEINETRAEQLADLLPHADVVCGDGSDRAVLLEQGLDNQDAFVALTTIDEENIITTMYAAALGVGKTVAKVNRVSHDILHSIGIDTAVSSKTIAANQILGYVRALENSGSSSVQTLYKLVDDRVEALEFRIVSDKAFYIGRALKDLELKDDVIIGCIIRKGKFIYPRGDDMIEAGDNVIVISAARHGFTDFEKIFR
ncbi:MAG TPA: Trk system potassium transporter TrkA [Candidatus Fimenecus stercoravium]|nr:Trk system potassium transporter TrkA [Candidatus Fimenecus stercoravium]